MTKTKTHEQYELELFDLESTVIPIEKYITARTKIAHECINGHITHMMPTHVLKGHGCKQCRNKTHDLYLIELRELKSDIAPVENYINARTKILHKCNLCKYEWQVSPRNVLASNSKGCPACAEYSFSETKPAILYYIKFINGYYKIGVSNRTIKERFKRDLHKIDKVLVERKFSTGKKAKDIEQKILAKYSDFRVTEDNFLVTSGNTEFFIIDVLNKEIGCGQHLNCYLTS